MHLLWEIDAINNGDFSPVAEKWWQCGCKQLAA